MAWTHRTCKLKLDQRYNLVKFYYFREKEREREGGERGRGGSRKEGERRKERKGERES